MKASGRLIVAAIFIFVNQPAFASTEDMTQFKCEHGKLRIVTLGKTEYSDADYCYNLDRTSLISKPCLRSQKRCQAVANHSRFSLAELQSRFGKPGFALCRKLGALPEIIEFSVGAKFFKLDRCTFADGSFVDSGTLLGLHKL